YLGGVQHGVVLIVGRRYCRGLRLENGEELWKTETGTPSGQGVFAGGTYWLPLKNDAGEKEPCVAQLDVTTGAVKGRAVLPERHVPGNLVVMENQVVSQSPLGVAAFGPAEKD